MYHSYSWVQEFISNTYSPETRLHDANKIILLNKNGFFLSISFTRASINACLLNTFCKVWPLIGVLQSNSSTFVSFKFPFMIYLFGFFVMEVIEEFLLICVGLMKIYLYIKLLVYNLSSIKTSTLISIFFLFICFSALMNISFLKEIYE